MFVYDDLVEVSKEVSSPLKTRRAALMLDTGAARANKRFHRTTNYLHFSPWQIFTK